MMRQMLLTMIAVLVLVPGALVPVAGQATEPNPESELDVIDLGNVSVRFQVRVFGFARIGGHFERLVDKLVNTADRETGSVHMCIDVSSINTRDDTRDEFLRSPAFFNTERYPQITFSNSRLVLGKDGLEQIIGDLSLHGMTRPVVFHVEPVGSAQGMNTISYQAKVTIRRSDFGLVSLRPVVSDEVEIIVAMQAN
jgi:polyisoprenoid-binding protein YceI